MKISRYEKMTSLPKHLANSLKLNKHKKPKTVRFENYSTNSKTETDQPQIESSNDIEETPQEETEDETIHADFSDLQLSWDNSDFWLDKDAPNKITQLHINDKRTATYQTIVNKRKISTLWDTKVSKSVTSKRHLDKLYYTDKICPCTGIRASSASGNKMSPIGEIKLKVNVEKLKLALKFIVFKNHTRPLSLGIDFQHKFCIGADRNAEGKLFLHRNEKLITITHARMHPICQDPNNK